VNIPVATRTCGEFGIGEASYTVRAMNAHGLFGDHIAVTFSPAIHGIESAAMPAVCTYMAVEALCRAVWGVLELRHVDFVAIVTGILFLGDNRLYAKRQAADEDRGEHTHGELPCVRFGKPGYQQRDISNITHCRITGKSEKWQLL
jgi:hypothetical protein